MANLVAVMSVPRYGLTSFYGHAIAALYQSQVSLKTGGGVYWGQQLQCSIKDILDNQPEFDGIITVDYDTVFKSEHIEALRRLSEGYPEAAAIVPVQMGRHGFGVLAKREQPIQGHELCRELVEVESGHFGLTYFRADALRNTPYPWFTEYAGDDGTYGPDKIDADMHFWHGFAAAGNKTFLAPRIVLGHIEEMIKWPNPELDPIFQEMRDYNKSGTPAGVWK